MTGTKITINLQVEHHFEGSWTEHERSTMINTLNETILNSDYVNNLILKAYKEG